MPREPGERPLSVARLSPSPALIAFLYYERRISIAALRAVYRKAMPNAGSIPAPSANYCIRGSSSALRRLSLRGALSEHFVDFRERAIVNQPAATHLFFVSVPGHVESFPQFA